MVCLFSWEEDSNTSRDVMVRWYKTWLKIFYFLISHITNYECFLKTADMSLFTEIGNVSYFEASWKKYTSVKESRRTYLLWLKSKIINAILASCSIYVLPWLTDIIFAAICPFPRKGNPALEKRDNTFSWTTNSFQIIMVTDVLQNIILKIGLSTFNYKKLSRTVWVENTIEKIIFYALCNILIVCARLLPSSLIL